MATVRKRILPSGAVRWILDYRDGGGARRFRQFKTKAEAVSHETQVRGELAAGVHTPDSASVTVAEAAAVWLAACEARELEASTLRQYRIHVAQHISPALGHVKLSRLASPVVADFVDRLAKDHSRAMTRKITTSLKSIVSEAVRRGLTTVNAVREARVPGSSRDEGVPEFPSLAEIKLLLASSAGEQPPVTHAFVFLGLRASELRGLEWSDIDFAEGVVRIRRRADLFGKLGAPKSRAGKRDIPIASNLLTLLRAWRVAEPIEQRADGLVFPDAGGRVEDHTALYRRFCALQLACGITGPGKPAPRAKYGLHALRHACASLLIAEGWNAIRVAAFLGHASPAITMKVYAHAFKDAEGDRRALTRLEQSLLG